MWPWLPERVVVVHIPCVLTLTEQALEPSTAAVDRRSTPSARADRQEPLPMFRCPGSPGFP